MKPSMEERVMTLWERVRQKGQHHLHHRVDAELNLIPLIDIMSVMVAFLLVYSANVEIVQNSKGVEIPQSTAEVPPKVVRGRDDHEGPPVRAGRAGRDHGGDPRPEYAPIEPLRAVLERPMLVSDATSPRRGRSRRARSR